MADSITLDVVTPQRRVLTTDVDEVVIPGSQGYLGARPGHTPLLTGLGIGILSFRKNGQEHPMAVARGYAEILPDRVSILAETAETPEDVDVERARSAKHRAEKLLHSQDLEVDLQRAGRSLARAETRLTVAGR